MSELQEYVINKLKEIANDTDTSDSVKVVALRELYSITVGGK